MLSGERIFGDYPDNFSLSVIRRKNNSPEKFRRKRMYCTDTYLTHVRAQIHGRTFLRFFIAYLSNLIEITVVSPDKYVNMHGMKKRGNVRSCVRTYVRTYEMQPHVLNLLLYMANYPDIVRIFEQFCRIIRYPEILKLRII